MTFVKDNLRIKNLVTKGDI